MKHVNQIIRQTHLNKRPNDTNETHKRFTDERENLIPRATILEYEMLRMIKIPNLPILLHEMIVDEPDFSAIPNKITSKVHHYREFNDGITIRFRTTCTKWSQAFLIRTWKESENAEKQKPQRLRSIATHVTPTPYPCHSFHAFSLCHDGKDSRFAKARRPSPDHLPSNPANYDIYRDPVVRHLPLPLALQVPRIVLLPSLDRDVSSANSCYAGSITDRGKRELRNAESRLPKILPNLGKGGFCPLVQDRRPDADRTKVGPRPVRPIFWDRRSWFGPVDRPLVGLWTSLCASKMRSSYGTIDLTKREELIGYIMCDPGKEKKKTFCHKIEVMNRF